MALLRCRACRIVRLTRINMWTRKRPGDDFSSEIRAHLELETERLIADGLPPDEARAAARRAFGSVTAAQERFYESGRWLALDHVRQDVRGAARSVVRYPVAALVAIVSLAFGIGAMTTTLTVRDVVFRKPPLLYRHPEELSLVRVGRRDQQMTDPYGASSSAVLYRSWRDGAPLGIRVAAAAPGRLRDIRTMDRLESMPVRPVSPDFFSVLGVGAAAGGTFHESSRDERGRGSAQQGGDLSPPAVLSDRAWQTLFERRADALGSTIWIEHEPHVVIGVMPERFWFSQMNAPIWIPLDAARLSADDMLQIVARRPSGVTPEALVDALQPALTEYASQLPANERQLRLKTWGMEGTPMGAAMSLLLPYVLGASVLLTLLIACANVAVLMIAQWTAREHEIAIRASLGATRGRIVRTLLTESVLLAACGGALGVCTTLALRGVLVHRLHGDLAFFDLSIDPWVLLQSAVITVLTGIVAGMAPALYETRRLHANPLTTIASSDRTRQRWRHALVILEITVTVALLVETGSMIGGYQRAIAAEMGFDRRPLLSARVENGGGIRAAQLVDAVAHVPGVAAAAVSTNVPFMGVGPSTRVATDAAGSNATPAARLSISPGFFATLGVPLRAGRIFTAEDSRAARAAIINEALANRMLAGRAGVGSRIWIGDTAHDVVGVIADYAGDPLEQRQVAGKVFLPLPMDAAAAKRLQVVVRASGDPSLLVQTVRRQIRDAAVGNTVAGAFTYAQITETMGEELLVGTVPLVPLIAIGMLLTTAGIYGVLAFAITRRSRELAVRVAIGATGRDLVRLVTAHSLRLVLLGTAFGIGLTFGLSRIVRASGGAGSVYDPTLTAFVVPILIVAVIGALATWIPSRRVMNINPALVLRNT